MKKTEFPSFKKNPCSIWFLNYTHRVMKKKELEEQAQLFEQP